MTGKNVGIGVVIIIILALGAYIIVKNPFGATPAQQPAAGAPQDQATTTVQAQDVNVGTGTEATPGAQVSVLYIGYLGQISTSTVFDASALHKDPKTGQIPPLTFTLGDQRLIPGFQIGVNGMKVGGERLMAIPSALGYGAQGLTDASGTVIIPPGATLIFDVKLVDVKAPASTSTPSKATPTKTK
jgi:FKBP-type peptidyl-prolyl cis-trans isomerase FkpA